MFGKVINDQVLTIARKYPEIEICGYVMADGRFSKRVNTSDDPANSFRIRGKLPKDAVAIVHSHPGGPFYPSAADMAQQRATALPWGIVSFSDRHEEVFWFGDEVPTPPLVGRGFRHGVTDCYSLVRDFYREQHGITLKEFPRDWEWWNNDEHLYLRGFEEAGFVEIDKNSILPGDLFMATIRSKTINHAGVYLGNGLILHHTCGRDGYDPFRLSTVEPAARWLNFVTKVIRYENGDIDRTPGQGVRF